MHEQVKFLISKDYAAQRSDEWLKLRGTMLTASDLASAIGDNKYETPDGLIVKKCGFNKFTGNEATAHGNKYEDEARDIYCEKYNEVSHEIGLFQHPTIPWLGGSPDGITESGKLLEIKCPLRRVITPEVPEHYMPQLQLLMEVLDLEEAIFIQYKPMEITWPKEPEFVVTEVPRDRKWFAEKLPIMDAFWKRVLWHREHGCEELMKPKRVVKKRVKPVPVCEIAEFDDDEDDFTDEL